jgi:hypothetical protein
MKRLHSRLLVLFFGGLCAFSARAQTVIPNGTNYTSTTIVSGPATIDTNSNTVTVSNGADVTFKATTSVRLGPGFTVASGGLFHILVLPTPVITSSATASGVVGAVFNYTITANSSPTSFSASGLPGSLSLNTSTGVISGTPGTAGAYGVTLGATNAAGTGTLAWTLTILSGPDTDGDGIPDSIETAISTDPNSAAVTTPPATLQFKVNTPR